MKAEIIGGGSSACLGGDCPTVYKTDRDTLVVQGYVLTGSDRTEFSTPENESVVEIPADVLLQAAAQLRSAK